MTGTGPLGASGRSRESTASLSDTSDPTPASANDKLVTMAARPTAEECARDRRLEERLARLAVALRPRIASQIASDAPDLASVPATDKSATASSPTTDELVTTAPLGALADIRRTPRWLNSATIAVSLVVVAAGWWLYRSEVANSVEMTAEHQQLAESRQAQQQAEASAAAYQGSLTQERDKAEKLASELATARRELEAQKAALAKASDRTAENQQLAELRQARQQAEASAATYQGSLAQERDKAAKLAGELATARRALETQAAALTKASDGTAENQQLAELRQARQQAEASAATYQGSLTQERDKAEKLAGELATARRALETQAAALAKASDRTAENQQLAALRQARQQAEASAATYQESLVQERARSQALEQQLAALRDATSGRGRNATTSTSGPTPARATDKPATTPPATSDKPATMAARPTAPDAPGNPEVARLMARASVLLSQGNVGAARIVLDRAAETGSAPALFALAETYDPFVLAAWGTFGTQGDAVKARELYTKAFAGGVQEAGDRLNALRQ